MKLKILFFFFLMFSTSLKASDYFSDFYQETAYLSSADTFVHLSKLRYGQFYESHQTRREYYLLLRVLGDSRTLTEDSSNIYNDNSVFLGPAFDVLGLLPGVRLTASLGYSQDLSSKIDKSAWDYQLGLISYHEKIMSQHTQFFDEWYSELIYQKRHENIFFNLQNRWKLGEYFLGKFPLRPRFKLSFSWDAQANNSARYLDTSLGLRWSWNAFDFIQLYLDPQILRRTALEANARSYGEFRMLLWAYKEF
jgi:hypothetical protein